MFRTWAQWATKKLKKERSSALLAEKDPDFRLALITAFDAFQIMIDEDKIRSIKIEKDDNLQDPEFLKRFWQSALALPSTAHHKFFCEQQDLQMFGTKQGRYRQYNSLQHVKNVHIPIVFTSDGHIDKLYLETYYEKCKSKLTYEHWLALQNVSFYAELEQLAILEPKVYRQALSTEKPGLLKAYQNEFAENRAIGFEAWYDGQDSRPRHDGKLTTEYRRYSQPSSSAEDDEEGTDRQVYTSTPKGSMDEMSQEATASFRPCLRTADKEKIKLRFSAIAQDMIDDDDKYKKYVESSFIYQYGRTPKGQEVTAYFRTRLTSAEKDEIAQEVSAISNRAAAWIMDDDDDEFQKYVEATAKYGRTPTGLKFDHYSNADFIKRRDSPISAQKESMADYKRIMAIDQMTKQLRTERRSRSTLQRSEGRATAPTNLTEYSANSDKIRKMFALSTKDDDSKDQLDRSEQIRQWEHEAQKLIARAPSRKRDKLQKVHDNWARSYEVSFKDYVEFMSDAFSLPSNSDLDQSRNSDYDMFDDKDKEGDSREINGSSPDVSDLSKWSDKQWYNLFARCMVPNPPLMSSATVITLSQDIRAQTRHPKAERFLNWIGAEDFSPNGRFSHVFIPNYLYVPTDILTDTGKVALCVTDVHYYLIWYKLYRARRAAADAYQLQHKELKPYEWIIPLGEHPRRCQSCKTMFHGTPRCPTKQFGNSKNTLCHTAWHGKISHL